MEDEDDDEVDEDLEKNDLPVWYATVNGRRVRKTGNPTIAVVKKDVFD